MSDLVGNPEDRFSRVTAQKMLIRMHIHVFSLGNTISDGSNII